MSFEWRVGEGVNKVAGAQSKWTERYLPRLPLYQCQSIETNKKPLDRSSLSPSLFHHTSHVVRNWLMGKAVRLVCCQWCLLHFCSHQYGNLLALPQMSENCSARKFCSFSVVWFTKQCIVGQCRMRALLACRRRHSKYLQKSITAKCGEKRVKQKLSCFSPGRTCGNNIWLAFLLSSAQQHNTVLHKYVNLKHLLPHIHKEP